MTSVLVVDLGHNAFSNREPISEKVVAWRTAGLDVTMLTTRGTRQQLEESIQDPDLRPRFVTLPYGDDNVRRKPAIALEYGRRIVLALVAPDLPAVDVVYSTSSVLHDVIPAHVIKWRGRAKHWAVLVDNLVPPPAARPGQVLTNTIAYLAYLVSLRLIKRSDLVFTVTKALAEQLCEQGVPPAAVRITGNGIPLQLINRASPLPSTSYAALFLGRIHPAKGILDLVEAWQCVTESLPQAQLAIVGRGTAEDEKALDEAIKRNCLASNVQRLGYVGGMAKFSLLKSSDLVVLPSYDESYGVAVAEAMACRRAVVAYDLPVYRQLYPPRALALLPPGDLQSLTAAIFRLLSSREARVSLGQAGHDAVQRRSWASIAELEAAGFASLLRAQ